MSKCGEIEVSRVNLTQKIVIIIQVMPNIRIVSIIKLYKKVTQKAYLNMDKDRKATSNNGTKNNLKSNTANSSTYYKAITNQAISTNS